MNIRIILLLLAIPFLPFIAHGQNYIKLTKAHRLAITARAALEAKDYAGAISAFEQSFKKGNNDLFDYYQTAICYAQEKKADNAFSYLFKSAEQGFNDLDNLVSDTSLKFVHHSSEWDSLLRIVGKNHLENSAKYSQLKRRLLDIQKEDQGIRHLVDSVVNNYGVQSKHFDTLAKQMNIIDSACLEKITRIVGEYGWVGPLEVGTEASNTIFFVIQHANLDVHLKYFDMMERAVRERKILAADFALVIDRIRMDKGIPQLYGSQVIMNADNKLNFYKIKNVSTTNRKRKEIGLSTLEEYGKFFGI